MKRKKFTWKQKRDRNRRLVQFSQDHPEYTHEALAGIFHMDRTRVTRILNNNGLRRKAPHNKPCKNRR